MIVIGAGTNAIHAMNVPLPHRETAGIVSAAPWLLLLLAFSLWVTTLRQSRTRRAARSAEVPVPEAPVSEVPVPEVTEPVTEPVTGADTREYSIVPGMTLEPELVPVPEPAPAAEETPPTAEAVWNDDAPAETLDAHEPESEPEVAEARSPAESESEASADESPASESPASGQPAITGSYALDYWDASEDDLPGASVVPAAHDTTDPDPAADGGDEVVEYSDEEEALAQARRAGQPLAREVHHGTAELAPESPAPATPELPFFSAPALRRMRSTPVPPGEDPDEDPEDQP
jgi:hypothetical protein